MKFQIITLPTCNDLIKCMFLMLYDMVTRFQYILREIQTYNELRYFKFVSIIFNFKYSITVPINVILFTNNMSFLLVVSVKINTRI